MTILNENGDFVNWTTDDPDFWAAVEASGADVTERALDQGYGGSGTGACNLYAPNNGPSLARIEQTIAVIAGNDYTLSFIVGQTGGSGAGLEVSDVSAAGDFTETFSGIAVGIKTIEFTATTNLITLRIELIVPSIATDVTIDDVFLEFEEIIPVQEVQIGTGAGGNLNVIDPIIKKTLPEPDPEEPLLPIVYPNLVLNGEFIDWTGDVPDSWTVVENISGEVRQRGFTQGNAGSGTESCNLYVPSPGLQFARLSQIVTVTPFKYYRIVFEVGFAGTGSGLKFEIYDGSGGGGITFSNIIPGTYSSGWNMDGTTALTILFQTQSTAGSGDDITIDNVTVRRA